MNAEIAGLGHYAPQRIVANAEIEASLGLEAGWILRRTGIAERRYAAAGETLSDMALAAAEIAIETSGIDRQDFGLLLLATSTPDHLLPPTAPLLAHRLSLSSPGAVDMTGACSGFIYALSYADMWVKANQRPAIVIGANILSRRINPHERASAVLFADAAGAVALKPTQRKSCGVLSSEVVSDGSAYGLIKIPGGGSAVPFAEIKDLSETLMAISDGQTVFQRAAALMSNAASTALTKAKLGIANVQHFIPHQANARMMSLVARQLDAQPHSVLSTIRNFGNSSAATIPFTMSYLAKERQYKHGDTLLLTAAGAGLSGGAVVLRW